MHRHYEDIPDKNWQRARSMRREQTPAERKLWRRLRNDQLGATFRRQHPIGNFIVDFVCLQAMLVVELDGHSHGSDDAEARDAERTRRLERRGFRVIRISNTYLHANEEGVIKSILDALERPPLIPPRSAEGDQSSPSDQHELQRS